MVPVIAGAISAALALADYVPDIVKWITRSNKAEEIADTVVQIAKDVTGETGLTEAVQALRDNPELVIQFKEKVLIQGTKFEELFFADKADARSRDVEYLKHSRNNWSRYLVLAVIVILLILTGLALMFLNFKEDSIQVGFLITAGGILLKCLQTIVDFEHGSSRSSQEKDVLFSRLLDRS